MTAADGSFSIARPRAAAALERRRRLGLGLLAFGLSGLVLICAATLLVLASLSAVDDAATGFERQRAQVVALLEPASDSLSDAATSAANAGASLTETRDAATSAARLTARLAESFEGLAALGSFELLGTRPFGDISGQFAAVAIEARTLSAELQQASIAMDTNIADSAAVAASLGALADQLAALRATVEGPASEAPDASLPIAAARLVLLGLLAWLAVPAVLSAWLGWRWSRRGPRG